jgi:hypothetical protein
MPFPYPKIIDRPSHITIDNKDIEDTAVPFPYSKIIVACGAARHRRVSNNIFCCRWLLIVFGRYAYVLGE